MNRGGRLDAALPHASVPRERSKLLFGNADRLEVAFAVAPSPSGVVHTQGLRREPEITPARARAQLLAFVAAA